MLPMHGSGETRCTGPFLTGDCPDGSIQALSTHVLHQIDVWVFLLALFQASVSGRQGGQEGEHGVALAAAAVAT